MKYFIDSIVSLDRDSQMKSFTTRKQKSFRFVFFKLNCFSSVSANELRLNKARKYEIKVNKFSYFSSCLISNFTFFEANEQPNSLVSKSPINQFPKSYYSGETNVSFDNTKIFYPESFLHPTIIAPLFPLVSPTLVPSVQLITKGL